MTLAPLTAPDPANLLRNPRAIGDAPWIVFNSTVTSGYGAPDGSASAVLVSENRDIHQHDIRQQFGPVIGGAVYSLSCHAKAGSRHWVHLVLWDHGQANSGGHAWFNLATGTVGTAQLFGGASAHLDSRMEEIGNGWFRCELSCRVSTVATAGSYTAQIQIATHDGNVAHHGDGASGIQIWAPHVARVGVAAAALRSQANLLSCSNAIGTLPWEPMGLGVTDGFTAPDGDAAAVLLREADSRGEHDVRQIVGDVLPGQPYTLSCFCKASSRDWVRLVLWDNGAGNCGASAWFDLAHGTLGRSSLFGDGASDLVCWMECVGNGWFRCVLTCVVSEAAPLRGYMAQIQIAPGDGVMDYPGDGRSGILAWGAQLEPRRTARPLWPTGDLAAGDPAPDLENLRPGASWLRAMPTPLTETLDYGHNRGGLNNQKFALLGMFLMARRHGPRRIVLPDFYAADSNRAIGRTVAFDSVFDAARVRDFAARHDIEILPDAPADSEGGWEYMSIASTYVSHNMAVRNLGPDDFLCDLLRALQPRIVDSGLARRLADAIFGQRGIQVVLQLRVELDWVRYVSQALMPSSSALEECELSFASIIRKTRNGLGASEAGILVTCDEAYLPYGKSVIRDVIKQDLGIDLVFKSDLLTADERRSLTRLDLSLLDFELAVAAPFYVGQSRSTFSNFVGMERYARSRTPVTNHYIYNIRGAGLGRRTDNGAFCVPDQVMVP